MVDVLLTHSNHLYNDAKQMRKMQPYPPLGTLYAATALHTASISVAVFDSTFVSPIAGFRKALQEHRPKIVVIYEDDFNFVTKMCLGHMRDLTNEFSTIAHAEGIPVIVHGSDATDHPEAYLDHGADYILNGEAEQSLTDLCQTLLREVEPQNISGLVRYGLGNHLLRDSKGATKNPEWVSLPRSKRDLIDLKPYQQAWTERHGYFSTNVVSSRGCPYRCNWCAKPISGDKFHLREAKEVADEILELKTRYGVEHIWFGDDVFALNHHWVEQFALAMESYSDPIPFKVQSRADLMSETTVAALKRAGCAEIWMGVESGSQKILNAMTKGLKLSTIYTARERLSKAGIRACFFIQFGYPGEGWNEICETFKLVRDTRPDDIGVSLSYPLPGTTFFNQVQEQLGSKRNWNDSDDLCAIFTATYKDHFYHALRDALHAEVAGSENREALWNRVLEIEPTSKNPNATTLNINSAFADSQSAFMPLESLKMTTGGA